MEITMKKIFKHAIVTLFNPISPIVTLIIGWILTIMVTEPNKRFPWIINYMIENPFIIAIFIIFWLLFSFIYTELMNRIEYLNKEIDNDKVIISEKDTQLKHTSGIVLNRSGDFAYFNKLLRFNEVLESFTENNTIVECVQMYRYSTKRVDNSVVIKVEYDCCYCSDGIDINNLAQCYYDIDYNDYHIIKDIVHIWKRLSLSDHMSYTIKDAIIKELVREINYLYRKYNDNLKSLNSIADVKSYHFTQYRIMTLLLRLARRQSTTMFDKNKILGADKSDIENYLLNGKRTGILNSILLEDIFMFKYTRNSHKKDGRAYIAFPMNISMQNYICVFSIQTLELDKNIDLEYEIKALRNNIIDRFEKK